MSLSAWSRNGEPAFGRPLPFWIRSGHPDLKDDRHSFEQQTRRVPSSCRRDLIGGRKLDAHPDAPRQVLSAGVTPINAFETLTRDLANQFAAGGLSLNLDARAPNTRTRDTPPTFRALVRRHKLRYSSPIQSGAGRACDHTSSYLSSSELGGSRRHTRSVSISNNVIWCWRL